jgi:poly(beta-D-mannuronate) lyase
MSLYILDFNQLKDIQPELIEGDTVLIKDGTYPDLSLTINNKALLNKRITIKSENFGKVILTGNCKINIIGNYITFGDFIFKDGGIKNSVEIKGLGNRITNCDFSFNNSDGPIIAIHSKNNRIDHCIFHDFTKAGVWVEVIRTSINDYVLIDHNIFRNRSLGIGNGFETIRIGTSGNSLSDSNSIIYNNLFENCDGELEAISNKSSGNIIYKNTLVISTEYDGYNEERTNQYNNINTKRYDILWNERKIYGFTTKSGLCSARNAERLTINRFPDR